MTYSLIDTQQRKAFVPISPWADTNPIGLEDLNCIQFDMPACLMAYMCQILEEYGEDLSDCYTGIDSAGNASCSLDYSDTHSRHELQVALIKAKVPHTVYLSNESEHWIRADYRYIDGEYLRHFVTYEYEYIGIHTVEDCIQTRNFKFLEETILSQKARLSPVPYTYEDHAAVKPLALKYLVKG